jgi:amino acid transporter
MAPKILAYVDKAGRPLTVIAIQLVIGLLGYINLAPNGGEIFTWLLALTGLAIYFVYASVAVSHIRFRKAW